MKLCFATNNQHKLKEVQALLGDQFELVTLADIGCDDEIPEPFDTIEENSEVKAKYIFEHYGIDCFADDSGLLVNALDGAPGVISAMYAGPQRIFQDNINLLLKNLAPFEDHAAHFKTVITIVLNGMYHQFEGIAEGQIIFTQRGTNGFGYDPVFVPNGFDKTFAEMTLEEKSLLSHRAKAFTKLVAFLKETNL